MLLTCTDPWQRSIALVEDRWIGHILGRHSELAPHLQAIEATLTSPAFVTRDRRHDNREGFYRPDLLPDPLAHLYVKVVVEFAASATGVVITAYPVPSVTAGEIQLWP